MNGRHAARGGKRGAERRVVETSEYVAMMLRIIGGWGDRVARDPAALAHLRELQATLADQTNRGIFEANRSAAHYSQNEMAAMLEVSRQAIAKRVTAGEVIYARRQEAAGAGPLVRLADVRAARAAGLASAGVADVTGSPRERAAAAM